MPIAKLPADHALYRIAIEQTKDYALFLLDTSGRVMTWNAGAERIKGYSPEEIIGRHFSTFYTHESIESAWPTYELKTAEIEGRFVDEGWRVRKDGSRFWASVVITALRGDKGKDTIHGDGGNDTIQGGDDDDFIAGNFGNDTIRGGEGNDRIFGDLGQIGDVSNGADTIKGG